MLLTPAAGNSVAFPVRIGLPFAVDNSAFSNPAALAKFPGLLDSCEGKPGCLWVACPDVVCDAAATLDLFAQWRAEVAARGLPVALVAQNGIGDLAVPWDFLDCVFVGGDDAFKDGPEAEAVCREAKRLGKLVHVGRVNSGRRVRLCRHLAADSFDGTGVSRWSEANLPKMIRFVDRALAEQNFWGLP